MVLPDTLVSVERALLGKARGNGHFRLQGPVDRTLAGDLEELRTLLLIEIALESNHASDTIDMSFPGLAVLAVGRVYLVVREVHHDALERKPLVLGVGPDRHRRARAERRSQQVVRRRTGVQTSRVLRLVRA